ncbi:MAG: MFS transporter [Cytophagaceae bacterium]
MKKEKLLLLLLAAIQFTHVMDFMILMPLGPQLLRIFSIDATEFSILVSAYTFSAGISGFFGTFYMDKFDRKSLILVSFAGFTISTIACALAPDYTLFLGARIFAGAFGGIIAALILAVVGDAFPYEKRGSAMGFVMAAFSVASVFGIPFGLYIANIFSWHAPFLFLGGLSLILLGFLLFFFPNMNSHIQEKRLRASPIKILQEIAADKNQVMGLLLMVTLVLGQFTVLPFISTYMVANVGFTEHDLTYIYLIGGAATIFTGPLTGKLADKFGKSYIFKISVFLSLIPILIITHLSITTMPVVLVVTTFLFIIMGGRMIPAMALITSAVKPSKRGSFMSISSSVQQLSAGFSAFLTGLILSSTPDGQILYFERAGYFAVIASILAVIVALRIKAVDVQ